jgi:dienelactone hydrolase
MAKTVDVQAEWVSIPDGEHRIPGYLARPRGTEVLPGVVVVPDSAGLVEGDTPRGKQHIFDTAQDLAGAGYVVLCVDIESHEGGATMSEDAGSPPDPVTMQDLGAGLRFLEGRPDVRRERIGVVGFCHGGRAPRY